MCHSAFCVRPERTVRLFPFLIVSWGVAALFQTPTAGFSLIASSDFVKRTCNELIVRGLMIGYSTLCFMSGYMSLVWAHFEQGYVTSSLVPWVFVIPPFRGGSSLSRSHCSS